VPHLTGLDQLLHRARDILDGHVGIDTVLVIGVDDVDPEPRERALDRLPDAVWAAAQPAVCPVDRVEVEAELRDDHDLVPDGSQSLTHQLLVDERPGHLGGVEEGDAPVHGLSDERDVLVPVVHRTVALAHPMQPRPMVETSRPFPSVRFCMSSSSSSGRASTPDLNCPPNRTGAPCGKPSVKCAARQQ
jgi:hypothetical protein